MKKILLLMVAATFGLAGTALALHDGGVARCEACHTMHNSLNNDVHVPTLTGSTQFTTGPMLLKGSDASSACLTCHGKGATTSGYHVSTAGMVAGGVPQQFTPGGDFSWIQAATNGGGSKKGHNIVAADFSYSAETRMTEGPGGDYPVGKLGCQSCHDPHGKFRIMDGGVLSNGAIGVAGTSAPIHDSGSYGVEPTTTEAVGAYRLLAGNGYLPKSLVDTPTAVFTKDIPAAIAPSTYNDATLSGGARVAYGSGMSEWCANCHAGLHNDDYPTNLRHPSGNAEKLTSAVVANYNAYVKTGDLTGTVETSFLPLVPFETGQSHDDLAGLTALVSATTGPEATANVMCLSCHRVHASGFNSMLRWDHTATLVAENGAYVGNGGAQGTSDAAQLTAAYYNKPASDFASYQRSLCNKCHAKD